MRFAYKWVRSGDEYVFSVLYEKPVPENVSADTITFDEKGKPIEISVCNTAQCLPGTRVASWLTAWPGVKVSHIACAGGGQGSSMCRYRIENEDAPVP